MRHIASALVFAACVGGMITLSAIHAHAAGEFWLGVAAVVAFCCAISSD